MGKRSDARGTVRFWERLLLLLDSGQHDDLRKMLLDRLTRSKERLRTVELQVEAKDK